jgi:SAM-dependent methyltransferase
MKCELGAAELKSEVGDGADVVFASRLLHHAPRPVDLLKQLAKLCKAPAAGKSGGAVLVLDYARHDDEKMRDEADLWLGFEPAELRALAKDAGLEDAEVTKIPSAWCGKGKDSHLPWQVMTARKKKS